MDKEQRNAIIDALVKFAVRVAGEGATDEEIAVLPAIASLLLTIPFKN